MTGRRLEQEEGKKRKRELHIETREGGFHQAMQLYVGRQLLDSVSLEKAPGADDEGIGGRSKKMGFGTQASDPVVDEYLCLRGAREYGDHDGGRGTQVTVCEQVQESGLLLPPEGKMQVQSANKA